MTAHWPSGLFPSRKEHREAHLRRLLGVNVRKDPDTKQVLRKYPRKHLDTALHIENDNRHS